MAKKGKVIAIAGPTASGKSALAVWTAKKLGGEVISADSRQIYKEFDIASAKPDESEKNGIAHHMIDVVNPTEDFTVADFTRRADEIIKNISEKGKIPIIAGGTGLYFRALLQDFDIPEVPPDKNLREKLNNLAQKEGNEAVYRILQELDFELSKKIHPNNTVKIIRAIEVTKALNIPMSQAQGKKEPPYDVLWIGLNAQNRDFLYNRINLRVDEMMKKGLYEEAKNLFEKYGPIDLLMGTIGYQELYDCIFCGAPVDEAVEKIKQNTRRYAKRQLTWFRANKLINWIEISEDAFVQAEEILRNHGYLTK